MKNIERTVYPSNQRTIMVQEDDVYGGAHDYILVASRGFENGQAVYEFGETHLLKFVRKNDDGSVIPGLQSEQVAIVLLDRAEKLNKRFPSAHNEKMIRGLEMFLEACRERVEERISRGVMWQLKA